MGPRGVRFCGVYQCRQLVGIEPSAHGVGPNFRATHPRHRVASDHVLALGVFVERRQGGQSTGNRGGTEFVDLVQRASKGVDMAPCRFERIEVMVATPTEPMLKVAGISGSGVAE
jgi:hypothetical protein